MLSPIRTNVDAALSAVLGLPGACRRFARDETVFVQGETADHVYQVISGAVRTSSMLRDGRRQIDQFHFVGDYLGLEMSEVHRVTAEAMADASVRMIRRRTLGELVAKRGDVAQALFRLTAESLQRSQGHVMMLGRRSASERVAGLLLDIAERTQADAELDVPMSRQDMADYLGLTIETVSRTLTILEDDGLIDRPNPRHVVLKDRRALEHMTA
jgi:CRP/FNR family transcriptional regulator, nitrogen fixation regulation protein